MQLQPGDAPPVPLWGGPNVLDERKLDLWTRASSNGQLWDLQLRTTADNELVGMDKHSIPLQNPNISKPWQLLECLHHARHRACS